jgi:hypothetical protein
LKGTGLVRSRYASLRLLAKTIHFRLGPPVGKNLVRFREASRQQSHLDRAEAVKFSRSRQNARFGLDACKPLSQTVLHWIHLEQSAPPPTCKMAAKFSALFWDSGHMPDGR